MSDATMRGSCIGVGLMAVSYWVGGIPTMIVALVALVLGAVMQGPYCSHRDQP